MRYWKWRLALIPILLVAAYLRLTGNDWDGYEHYHPDERYITWVGSTIEWPDNFVTAFSPQLSSFNPYYWSPEAASKGIVVRQDSPRDFAYGHLPLYLGVAARGLFERLAPPAWIARAPAALTLQTESGFEWLEFNLLVAVGRALTALFDVGTVFLLYRLGSVMYDRTTGLVAAALLALNVMHIQLAHFFTVDPYVSFFVVAALTAMVIALKRDAQPERYAPRSVRAYFLLASLCTGLAIGSKFSAVLLALPLLATTYWVREKLAIRRTTWLRVASPYAIALATVGAAFIVSNPFAAIDFSCDARTAALEVGPLTIPEFNLGSCFLYNIGKQSSMVDGTGDFAFTRQYAGTIPYLYHLEMQARWGMGPLPALLAVGGLGWVLWRSLRAIRLRRSQGDPIVRPAWRDSWVLLLWAVPFLVSTGSFYVKFMRYLEPVTPLLMLFGAAWVISWRGTMLKRIMIGATLLSMGVYAFAFVNIYNDPHPWASASRWIYDNVPTGSLIVTEQWGDPLPSVLDIEGVRFSPAAFGYESTEATWLTNVDEADTLERLKANLERLAAADFVVVESNRSYGVVPRLPDRYPLSSQAHPLLFAGDLGYELVYVSSRSPRLGIITLYADFFDWPAIEPPDGVVRYLENQGALVVGRVDESFTLYDQSLVMIFANTGQMSTDAMLRRFDVNR